MTTPTLEPTGAATCSTQYPSSSEQHQCSSSLDHLGFWPAADTRFYSYETTLVPLSAHFILPLHIPSSFAFARAPTESRSFRSTYPRVSRCRPSPLHCRLALQALCAPHLIQSSALAAECFRLRRPSQPTRPSEPRTSALPSADVTPNIPALIPTPTPGVARIRSSAFAFTALPAVRTTRQKKYRQGKN